MKMPEENAFGIMGKEIALRMAQPETVESEVTK